MFIHLNNNTKKSKPQTTRKTTLTIAQKIEQGKYEDLSPSEIVTFFETTYQKHMGKSKEHNRGRAIETTAKLLEDFTEEGLINCIRFVYESDQTLMDRERFGIGGLKVENFIDYIEENLESFLEGRSVKKVRQEPAKVDRKREWGGQKKRVNFELPDYN